MKRRANGALATAGEFAQRGGMKIARAGWGLALLLGVGVLFAAGADEKAGGGKEAAKIEGVTIERPNGTFLGLQIKDNNFVLTFYNKKKEKMAPDVTRATVRWPVKYQPNDERTVLNPGGDEFSLSSPRTVRPPHNFKVYLLLFVDGNDDPVESYNLSYRE
jgi:hypothetical protein